MDALLRQFVNYLQVMATVGTFRIQAPEVMADVLALSSSANGLSLELVPVQCLLRFSFSQRVITVSLFPLVILMAATAAYGSRYLLLWWKSTASTNLAQAKSMAFREGMAAIVVAMFIVWNQLLTVGLSVFATHSPDIEGRAYLRADFSVHTDMSSWRGLAVLAVLSLIAYNVLFPVGVFAFLHKQRELIGVSRAMQPFGE